MSDRFQFVPFPIPEYLFQYFAHQTNSEIQLENGITFVAIDRRSTMGATILRNLSPDSRRVSRTNASGFYIKVSNFAGNNYDDTPIGKRQFLKLEQKVFTKLSQGIKSDFEEAIIAFIEGAEFAHRLNGWSPSQKRKGIRKHAILEFCEKHGVNTQKRTLEALFKLYQRHIKRSQGPSIKGFEKYVQVLSF